MTCSPDDIVELIRMGRFMIRRQCGHQCNLSASSLEECCRCREAKRWFRLTTETDQHHYGRSAAFIAVAKRAGWRLPAVDATHPGWHAGLRRPEVRGDRVVQRVRYLVEKEVIPVYDEFGVASGRGEDVRQCHLCAVCRAGVKETPSWLFWHARGWSPAQARTITDREGIRENPRWSRLVPDPSLPDRRTVLIHVLAKKGSLPPLGWSVPVPWDPCWTAEQRKDSRVPKTAERIHQWMKTLAFKWGEMTAPSQTTLLL
jgi:hypothetical protein